MRKPFFPLGLALLSIVLPALAVAQKICGRYRS